MLAEPDGKLISRELGLKLYRDATYLRLIDLATGEQIVHNDDLGDALRAAAEQARAAAEQARAEAAARRAAEEELERLRAERRRLRGEDS